MVAGPCFASSASFREAGLDSLTMGGCCKEFPDPENMLGGVFYAEQKRWLTEDKLALIMGLFLFSLQR